MSKHTKLDLTESGEADGIRDRMLVEGCPMGEPLGKDPELDWSHFYGLGYESEWALAVPHGTCDRCSGARG